MEIAKSVTIRGILPIVINQDDTIAADARNILNAALAFAEEIKHS